MVLCDICKKNVATLHFIRMENGSAIEVHYCQDCAEQKGVDQSLEADQFNETMDEAMKQDAAGKSSLAGGGTKIYPRQGIACPGCGLTFSRFKEIGRLGCPECYVAFREGKEGLKSLLRRWQGSVQHVGKNPRQSGDWVLRGQKVYELRQEMQKAINAEDYEEAARIRDEIRQLETR
jgi:protein arginine kinase activator